MINKRQNRKPVTSHNFPLNQDKKKLTPKQPNSYHQIIKPSQYKNSSCKDLSFDNHFSNKIDRKTNSSQLFLKGYQFLNNRQSTSVEFSSLKIGKNKDQKKLPKSSQNLSSNQDLISKSPQPNQLKHFLKNNKKPQQQSNKISNNTTRAFKKNLRSKVFENKMLSEKYILPQNLKKNISNSNLAKTPTEKKQFKLKFEKQKNQIQKNQLDLNISKQKIQFKDFDILVSFGKILYDFLEAFLRDQDFYTIFKNYIDFIQENDLTEFFEYIDKKKQEKFKNSLILTQAFLMISFSQLLDSNWQKESIFFHKAMQTIFQNYLQLFKSIYKIFKNNSKFNPYTKQLFEFYNCKYSNLNIKNNVKVKENNKKIQRFLLSQKNTIDEQVFNCLQKLCEFINDFSLKESQDYLLETFRNSYEQKGVTQENLKQGVIQEQVKQCKIQTNNLQKSGLNIISENSSERSSQNSENRKNYTLVLDLDETLVHYAEENGDGKIYFRPHLDYFLKEMTKCFEMMIFTAAQQDYADQVIDLVDPERKFFSKRFYRQDTDLIQNEILIKDLDKTGKDLSRVLIIDNIPENYTKQPDNGIFINSFYGEEKDTGLISLVPILKELSRSQQDVRDFLKQCKKNLIEKIDRGSLNPSIFFQQFFINFHFLNNFFFQI